MMDPRSRIVERVYARGTWTAATAIHLGGEGDGPSDMTLLRDSAGRFLIPGASIAGCVRHYLARSTQSREAYRSRSEPEALEVVFGKQAAAQANYASLLIVRDALATGAEKVFVRDGVRISEESGTAADEAKYDFEVLPAGTSFQFELILLLYDELPGGLPRDSALACFRAMLEALSEGEIRLGARGNRGLGDGRVSKWEVRRLYMSQPAHVAAWLRQNPYAVPEENWTEWPRMNVESTLARTFRIDVDLQLVTSLLVRGSGGSTSGVDAVHISEKGKSLMPGSGLGGALRAQCGRIARSFWGAGTQRQLDRMFGPLGKPGVKLQASRVRTSEAEVQNCQSMVQARVAIDRFTGGSKETALFDEAALWPKEGSRRNLRISIELADPEDQESGLLLLAFKDLWLGDLALGGGWGIGRGTVRGTEARIYDRGREILHMRSPGSGNAITVDESSDRERVEALVGAVSKKVSNA